MTDEIDTTIACLAIYASLKKRESKKRKHRMWMKSWLAKKEEYSHMKLLRELEITSPMDLKNFLRMDSTTYEELLSLVDPLIKRQDTFMRKAISTNERLSITLRYLATGQSYEDLKFLTGVSPQSIGRIVIETCKAITYVLKDFIKMPSSEEEWKEVACEFANRWNFPNCIGAMDGKHVHIKKPMSSGSYFYNYKKTFSIIMMAIVNANYEFMMVEVGANGRASDAGVFAQSEFKRRYDQQALHIPQPQKVSSNGDELPFVFVGDDAFPLLENLMKPYSRQKLTKEERIFNYRLSRARRIVENAFGILVNRFRVLSTNISLEPDKVAIIVICCCYLHNFISRRNPDTYLCRNISSEYLSESPPSECSIQLHDLEPLKGGNGTVNAKEIRNKYCNYFNSLGAVSWQDDHI